MLFRGICGRVPHSFLVVKFSIPFNQIKETKNPNSFLLSFPHGSFLKSEFSLSSTGCSWPSPESGAHALQFLLHHCCFSHLFFLSPLLFSLSCVCAAVVSVDRNFGTVDVTAVFFAGELLVSLLSCCCRCWLVFRCPRCYHASVLALLLLLSLSNFDLLIKV